MDDYSKLLGRRFFRRIDGELEVIKMISFVNLETARVININTGEKFKILYKDLQENYICLNPDGYIVFDIVDIKMEDKTIQDVIVSNMRTKDIENELNAMPYCVCRQNIINLYNEIIKRYDTNTVVGMSMTLDTIPEGTDYRIMLTCDGINHHISVAYYMDDKLDDILQCIRKISLYDNTLNTLYENNMKLLNKELLYIDRVAEQNIYGGYCRTLKLLLENNDFMDDVRKGFGITRVNTILREVIGDHKLSENETLIEIIEEDLSKQIINPVIMKYGKDIKLYNISRAYDLLVDNNDDIFVVVYDTVDDVIDEIHAHEHHVTTEDKLKMINNITNN